jgi:ubiquinone/menaquinone biosynthesis C-methylase UbiE
MGFYEERIVPRIINTCCGTKAMNDLRRRACAGVEGDVLEIGFGSGLNLPFYPASTKRLDAVEPADLGWKLAAQRVAAAGFPVQRSGLDGQSLPFDDETHDSALSTMTLCTIPDADAALREVHRVLKPGGRLHFMEHGLAPDAKVQTWQRRIEPLQKRLFAGCHVTRPISEMVTAAGFTISELDEFYIDGPKTLGALTLGVAVRG